MTNRRLQLPDEWDRAETRRLWRISVIVILFVAVVSVAAWRRAALSVPRAATAAERIRP